jgi:hypothetical protein
MGASAVASAVSTSVRTPRMNGVRIVFSWIGISLLAFPLFGLVGWIVGGHVDGVLPALIGGALTGAGIGLAQWLWLRRDLDVGLEWVPATAIALAAGLTMGAAAVGYETDAGSLAIMGAISGAAVGIAQGALLRTRFSLWLVWMIGMPIMWSIGWLVTEAGGINVSNQFTVFGAYGSIAFGTLSGLLLMAGNRTREGS